MTSRLTLLTIFLFTFNVNVQDLATVTISGGIVDQSAAVIPGAEVRATLIKTGQTRTTFSDAAGRYQLIQLEPGTYALRVSCNGFATLQKTGIVSVSGQSLELPITLTPASIEVAP